MLRETVWLALPSRGQLIKGKQITPGGVSLFGLRNLEGGPSMPVKLDYLDENHFTKTEESKPGTVAHTSKPGTWEGS